MRENGKLLRPLAVPMGEETFRKVQQLITVLHNKHHINEMTEKCGFVKHKTRLEFQPIFIPLRKSTNRVGRPIISGVSGPTEKLSAFC